jgi:hypothetical protein
LQACPLDNPEEAAKIWKKWLKVNDLLNTKIIPDVINNILRHCKITKREYDDILGCVAWLYQQTEQRLMEENHFKKQSE